ncbi:MAG: hypothetical protein H7X86_11305 [Gorillibacterium sp.]|nr:hypothetical protein [Gorillibacterium sp.]
MKRREGKSIYFLSGIGTSQRGNYFGSAMEDIVSRYRAAGIGPIHVQDLYPYGIVDGVAKRDFFRFLAYQAMQVSRDMYVRYRRNEGGLRAFKRLREDYDATGSGPIILIGHSGGGVAAYKTAKLLMDRNYPVESVILVGTPVQGIAGDWQNKVRCLGKAGRFGDPVTWWGRPCIGAPRNRATVDIVGGHPDYFCKDAIDINGVSNLSKVMDVIWGWLGPTD